MINITHGYTFHSLCLLLVSNLPTPPHHPGVKEGGREGGRGGGREGGGEGGREGGREGERVMGRTAHFLNHNNA